MTQTERRMAKYPNTKTFEFYNANPKGKLTGDCSVRALALSLDQSYNETYREMFELSIKTGLFIDEAKLIQKYIEGKGWIKHKQPRKADNTKYTGEEFCESIAKKNTRYLANIGGHHVVCIKDKKVHDTWDSTGGCIGNYWTK